MKFRTEIAIAPLAEGIDHNVNIFALGSCFAERMAERLSKAKFSVTSNPFGVLFNPLSIANTLKRLEETKAFAVCDIQEDNEVFFSFDAHSSLDGKNHTEAFGNLNKAVAQGSKALNEAEWVILTFGTAWIYERDGKVVANCHKQPSSNFIRRRVSVDEIIEAYKPLFEGVLRDKRVILTVSPVRHIGDGLQENSVSKATLRLAIEELCERYENAHYFPSFEIVVDDLRDYRYYGDDLVHPSTMAVEYIWEQFCDSFLCKRAKERLTLINQITTAAEHRPLNPTSNAHRTFCRKMIELAHSCTDIDFSIEIKEFEKYL